MQKGQTDIYVLKLSSNVLEQITNDVYDDKMPRFIDNDSKIIFTSNRSTDSLEVKIREDAYNKKVDNWDVYVYNYTKRSPNLLRLTETPHIDEKYPSVFESGKYTYLSDENGIFNRYIAQIDSAISHIDTTIHYRYFAPAIPITNYKRNIIYQDINPESPIYSEIIK